jgi:hypothetical protein
MCNKVRLEIKTEARAKGAGKNNQTSEKSTSSSQDSIQPCKGTHSIVISPLAREFFTRV